VKSQPSSTCPANFSVDQPPASVGAETRRQDQNETNLERERRDARRGKI